MLSVRRRDISEEAREREATSAQAAWMLALDARRMESPQRARLAFDSVRAPLPAEGHHRLLVGSGPAAGNARLYIDRGKLAGTELHLVAVGARVEVHVLTPHEASRQTLVIAM
jgi:hypothetical protein